jgi:hypothetical protein
MNTDGEEPARRTAQLGGMTKRGIEGFRFWLRGPGLGFVRFAAFLFDEAGDEGGAVFGGSVFDSVAVLDDDGFEFFFRGG